MNGEGTKAALPDVSAAMIVLVVASHVRSQEPHHVVAEVTVLARPEDQVEVIIEQTISEQAHGGAFAGLAQ